ncbi:MAG: DUF5684 domain-containing protein [Pseudomonadota bacterium]
MEYDVPATGFGWGFIAVWLVVYLFFAYCLAMIAKKTGREFGTSLIMAIIPIANIILILQIAGKPWWWLFLFLIPIVNLVLGIIVWMSIAEKRGKPNWWGILMIVPFANLVILLMLAFGKEGGTTPAAA